MDHTHKEWDTRQQKRPPRERLDVGGDSLRIDTWTDTSQGSHLPVQGYTEHGAMHTPNEQSTLSPNAPFRHRLDSQASDLDSPGEHEDNEHLTSSHRVSRYGAQLSPRHDHRRSLRESVGDGGGRALSALGRSIRRASVRVVNVAGVAGGGIQEPNSPSERGLSIVPPPNNRDDVVLRIQVPTGAEDGPHLPKVGGLRELRGRTLCFFGPTNPLRLAMQKMLLWTWTEPFILILIFANAIILTIQSSHSFSSTDIRPTEGGYFHQWEDYALLGLFVIFALEAFARIIVTGLFIDPEIPITSLRISFSGLTQGSVSSRLQSIKPRFTDVPEHLRPDPMPRSPRILRSPRFGPTERSSHLSPLPTLYPPEMPFNPRSRSVDEVNTYEMHSRERTRKSSLPHNVNLPFQLAIQKQRDLVEAARPYLRHSWNRVDAVAIISFWAMFCLAMFGLERTPGTHIYIFRALSVLRTTRLLSVSSGTATILRSLKKAAPKLVNVALVVLFAMVLFSIIGVQLFQGNFRRACVVESDPPIVLTNQVCGGQIDPVTLSASGYFQADGDQSPVPKGYICPLGQRCLQQGTNPNFNIKHFDNILAAALEIFIVASTNGWAPLMYNMMDADYFVSCIFFIICVIVLNFWLLNLFVGVITSTFSNIRAETNRSAFGAETEVDLLKPGVEDWERNGGRWRFGEYMQKVYDKVDWVFALLAAASVGVQGVKTVATPESQLNEYLNVERVITAVFDVEILWRFIATSPQWRTFFIKKRNVADLGLSLVCTVIIIPPIPNTEAYKWLTAFQLARFYRAILIVPGMRSLLYKVFGNSKGLFNMSMFLLLANYLAALFAIQLFRGDIDPNAPMNFLHVGNAFLAMYQILSSENWTNILWSTSDGEVPFQQQWIAILLAAGWLFFANFILLQMFIALINENFEVAEEQKRDRQEQNYIRRAAPAGKMSSWTDRFNPYLRSFRRSIPKSPGTKRAKRGKSILHPKKPSHSHNRAGSIADQIERVTLGMGGMGDMRTALVAGPLGTLRRFIGMDQQQEDVPLMTWNSRHTMNLTDISQPFAPVPVREASEHNALSEQRARRAITIANHPSYDKSLWIFSQNNAIRRFCQQFVPPSNDDNEERMFGRPPSPLLEFCFRAVMLLVVAAGIIVEAVATPIYRSAYYAQYGTKGGWFDISEAVFGFLLVVEFFVKIIADGFIFTPNAYLLNIWNIVDGIILVAILVNVSTSLIVIGGISRFTRSLKAFRALRLITLIGWMRETFHSVLFAGARRMLDAAILAILYMIPYAIWGLNIFSGMMYSCSDSSSTSKSDCEGIFISTPVDNSLGFYTPRVWSNPTPSTHFSFDSFGDSLLILFEIVSLEGWIDVLEVALGITGKDRQPKTNASQINAIFFLLYNLLGAVVILTLFVSIIIANFSTRSGMALLTVEQRQWVGLQKLVKRQRPSKRPKVRPRSPFRSWCFDRATNKHDWWSRMMTVLYVAHICVLMSQTFRSAHGVVFDDRIRNSIFMGFATIFLSDLFIRFVGLGWKSFRANGWNIFDALVVLGSILTTVLLYIGARGFEPRQAQKIFLVCIAFKLVQKLDSLNQLFKTAVSSLNAIAKLFGLWFALFLFFGMLFIEVFALTKWGSGGTYNQNYQSLGSALVMLAFMSTGEGWNQYMHNYAIEYPRCTKSNNPTMIQSIIQSDCGSRAWSFTLFIAWNVLSMFIFVNMFTGIVVENFSYVYQQQGTASLTREQMRVFKKAWAAFDLESTGYLQRDKIGPFLARLSGIFEVRVYPPEYHVKNLVAASTTEVSQRSPLPQLDQLGEYSKGFSPGKLDTILSRIDFDLIRQRRQTYDYLYWEACVTDDYGKGISFTSMLLLLCHYKLIDDDQALKLNELVRRRMITSHVHDLVNLDKVRSLLRMMHHRRRFLAHLARKRETELQRTRAELPEIVIAEGPVTPFQSWDITTADNPDPASPDPNHNSFIISASPRASESGWSDPASPRGHHHRAGSFNLASLGPGSYYPDSSVVRQRDSDSHKGSQGGASSLDYTEVTLRVAFK